MKSVSTKPEGGSTFSKSLDLLISGKKRGARKWQTSHLNPDLIF